MIAVRARSGSTGEHLPRWPPGDPRSPGVALPRLRHRRAHRRHGADRAAGVPADRQRQPVLGALDRQSHGAGADLGAARTHLRPDRAPAGHQHPDLRREGPTGRPAELPARRGRRTGSARCCRSNLPRSTPRSTATPDRPSTSSVSPRTSTRPPRYSSRRPATICPASRSPSRRDVSTPMGRCWHSCWATRARCRRTQLPELRMDGLSARRPDRSGRPRIDLRDASSAGRTAPSGSSATRPVVGRRSCRPSPRPSRAPPSSCRSTHRPRRTPRPRSAGR